ncbi:MAG: hypothetical protein JWQ83_29 [Lacunisphaera sp.]|nr:hypothetical protein [Lacunisphaera sp.]
MNASASTPAPRRRIWRWVLIGVGLCLAPWLALAVVVASYLTLDRDVAVLRQHVMAATGASWCTKVQMSVGRTTLGAVGAGLDFVHHRDMADARLALSAVHSASVGVYERTSGTANVSRGQLFNETDRAMEARGWTRLVGVSDRKDTVLIYVPQDMEGDGPIDICMAVLSGKELVVTSTSVDASALAELVAKHAGEDMQGHLRFAKLRF